MYVQWLCQLGWWPRVLSHHFLCIFRRGGPAVPRGHVGLVPNLSVEGVGQLRCSQPLFLAVVCLVSSCVDILWLCAGDSFTVACLLDCPACFLLWCVSIILFFASCATAPLCSGQCVGSCLCVASSVWLCWPHPLLWRCSVALRRQHYCPSLSCSFSFPFCKGVEFPGDLSSTFQWSASGVVPCLPSLPCAKILYLIKLQSAVNQDVEW